MKLRILHYRKLRIQLEGQSSRHQKALNLQSDKIFYKQFEEEQQKGIVHRGDPDKWDGKMRDEHLAELLNSELGDQLMGHFVGKEATTRSLERYPEGRRVMPTRLGNALRRFEDAAGAQYGLDAILTAPHFSLIAPDQHVQYLRDSRQQMDATIHLCTVSLLATIIAVAFLLTDGMWLLASLVPYVLAYVAYRAAVAAAHEYATAVTTVIDLNRFQLYESLRIDAPRNPEEERTANTQLMDLLGGSEKAKVRYSRDPQFTEQRLPRPGRPRARRLKL